MPRHSRPVVRLFVDCELGAACAVGLDGAQAHRLAQVMRLGAGDAIDLFNGRDGEWRAAVVASGAGRVELRVGERLREQDRMCDLWLVHAPIKGPRLATVVEKATELGVDALLPVTTRNTVVGRVNARRMRAQATAAAEQCGRLSVPEVRAVQSLDALLGSWPRERTLVFCDETGAADPLIDALRAAPAPRGGGWAVLIGAGRRVRRRRGRCVAAPAFRAAGQAGPPHSSRRYGRDRRAQPVAGGGRRLARRARGLTPPVERRCLASGCGPAARIAVPRHRFCKRRSNDIHAALAGAAPFLKN